MIDGSTIMERKNSTSLNSTQIIGKPPSLMKEARDTARSFALNEITSKGELIMKDSGLTSLPLSLLTDRWESVKVLDLRENQLTSIEVSPFIRLINMHTLDLRNNRIEELPSAIHILVRLHTLRLDHNCLVTLPHEIGEISTLELLAVSNNELACIPSSICRLRNLHTLIISENRIEYLPVEIGDLMHLRVLYTHKNRFSSLPISFQYLENLKEFSLEWFRYTSPPLPRVLKGHIGEAMIGSLRALCSKLYNSQEFDCKLLSFLQHFSEEEFEIDKLDSKRRTAIHTAAVENDCGVIKGLICAGGDIDLIDKDGCSALLLALKENNTEVAKILIEANANPNLGGGLMGSAVHLAAFKVQPWLVKMLISKGADVNLKDCEGNRPLHITLGVFDRNVYGSSLIAEMLVDGEAQVNAANNDQWAPLHLAARRRQLEAIKWVVFHNSKLEKQNRDKFNLNLEGGSHSWTPLHLAGHAGYFEIVQLLVEAGADLFIRNSDGRTPRQASKGDLSLFKYLVRAERESLKRLVLHSTQRWSGPEEPIQSTEEALDEAMNSRVPLWRRYRAAYYLVEIQSVTELRQLGENLEINCPLKAEVVYMLGQFKDKKAMKFLEVMNGDSRESQILRREAFQAIDLTRGVDVQTQKIHSFMGPKLIRKETKGGYNLGTKALSVFVQEETKKDAIMI
jgi:ankyrin repeat protein